MCAANCVWPLTDEMNIITPSIRCFLFFMFFILCTLSMAEVVSRRYTMEPSLDDKVSNNSLVTKHHSESLIECGIKCGEHCACFCFNPQQKKCHIHQSCDSSEMTGNEAGWRYFCPYGCHSHTRFDNGYPFLLQSHGGCDRSAEDAYSSMAPDPAFAFVEDEFAVDCRELLVKGHNQSGVYNINPTGKPCHTIRAIQRRTTPSVEFDRPWNDYKVGFGIPEAYWIGNEVIHQLTKGGNSSLYVSITLVNDTTLYELYEQFFLTDEADKYRLVVKGPATGTLGDSFRIEKSNSIHAGKPFSTHDQDNGFSRINCAQSYNGGWWFDACYSTFLNGPWTSWGIQWNPALNDGTAVRRTLMMIKPR